MYIADNKNMGKRNFAKIVAFVALAISLTIVIVVALGQIPYVGIFIMAVANTPMVFIGKVCGKKLGIIVGVISAIIAYILLGPVIAVKFLFLAFNSGLIIMYQLESDNKKLISVGIISLIAGYISLLLITPALLGVNLSEYFMKFYVRLIALLKMIPLYNNRFTGEIVIMFAIISLFIFSFTFFLASLKINEILINRIGHRFSPPAK